MTDTNDSKTRRRFLMAGAATSSALAIGVPGRVSARRSDTTEMAAQEDPNWRQARMYNDEFYSDAVFRVVSPALEDPPTLSSPDVVEGWTVRVIEYFNTNEEAYLYFPPDANPSEDELYRFRTQSEIVPYDDDMLVEVSYRPLDVEDLSIDIVEGDDYDFTDGGGEGAVRPNNLFTNALFRITSGSQGWVPGDVEQSGYFTDYNTHHAEYLGTSDRFLFFPQEEAGVEEDGLYVMWDEFELFDPAGNLAAIEFNAVDEETLSVDDDFL